MEPESRFTFFMNFLICSIVAVFFIAFGGTPIAQTICGMTALWIFASIIMILDIPNPL